MNENDEDEVVDKAIKKQLFVAYEDVREFRNLQFIIFYEGIKGINYILTMNKVCKHFCSLALKNEFNFVEKFCILI